MRGLAWSITVLALVQPARGAGHQRYTHQQILDAIRQVESNGDDDCPDGDEGRSIGPFQICRAFWLDAMAFDSTLGGSYEKCRERTYAERVVRAYMRRYVPGAWARHDAEVIARTHNGGPRGARKSSTLPFWRRVEAVLATCKPTRRRCPERERALTRDESSPRRSPRDRSRLDRGLESPGTRFLELERPRPSHAGDGAVSPEDQP